MFEGLTEQQRRAVSLSLRAADRSRMRGLVHSGLIHDLRSALQAPDLNLDLVRRTLAREEELSRETRWHQMAQLESVHDDIRRTCDQLADLWPLVEPGYGTREVIDVVETLPRLRWLQHKGWRRATSLNIRLAQELPEEPVKAVSIESGVEHAFLSITLNAFEAMPDGGTTTLRVQRTEGELRWEVEDDGPGIPEELGERIYEPYASTKEGHAGLGLFVARDIIREHGGRIRVTRGETRGTRVTVWLPAAEAAPLSREDSACRMPS